MGFLRSCNPWESIDELNFNIPERVYELDGEIFTVVHKLPFSNIIRKGIYHLHPEVRKSIGHMDLDIREGIHNPYPAGETDILIISCLIDRACGRNRMGRKSEGEKNK